MHQQDRMETDLSAICKELFERFPFGVIFSKSAPSDLTTIDYGSSFCYFYFSPGLEVRCNLRRANMLTGSVNAKRDFPSNYRQYFKDDADVVKYHKNGSSKAICEPWTPPGVVGDVHFVYTLKTALECGGAAFMLGTFELIGETVLDANTETLDITYSATSELPQLGAMVYPDCWFYNAFIALPLGMCILDVHGAVVVENNYWVENKHLVQIDMTQYHIDIMSEIPLNKACWFPASSATGHGLGVYHIRHRGEAGQIDHMVAEELSSGDDDGVYQVWVLRPSMRLTADPYYVDGTLHRRV